MSGVEKDSLLLCQAKADIACPCLTRNVSPHGEDSKKFCSCLEINHVSNYSRITGACLFPGKSTLMAQSPPKVADVSEKAVLPLHFIYVPEKPDTVVLKRN